MPASTPAEPSLFRPEAVAHQRQRLTGEAIVASPLPFRAAVLLLVLLAGAALATLSSATFVRSESARGVLVPPSGLVRAVATTSGTSQKRATRWRRATPSP